MTDPATDPTIAAPPVTTATQSEPSTEQAPPVALPNYRVAEVLGIGGMGEVWLARDERVGRDIAIKRMRSAKREGGTMRSGGATARFLREARIQARLEHPAIVPVYEIGQSADGSPFFAMKRISGTTLAELMRDEPEGLQRLLRVFVDVCHAVEFAHSRSVVHRDLKPANVIVGAFGEVYVLDWGLALVLGGDDLVRDHTIASDDGLTQAGATLGTPGYMAPEQIRDATSVGPRADVYALGATLFEILAREPVHPRGTGALATTAAGIDGSPARRRDVPPELDALCVAALALAPAARPSAGALADAVQRYLDGDREVTLRRTASAELVARARSLLDSEVPNARVEALREAGRALALDTSNQAAAALFSAIIVEPPKLLPDELRAHLRDTDVAVQQGQSRIAAMSFLGLAGFLGAIGVNGIRAWPQWLALSGLTAVMAFAAWWQSRRAPGTREMVVLALGNAALAALFSRAFGSLIAVPSITCVMAVSLTSYPQLLRHGRAVIAILVVSWVAPVALESAGAIESTWMVKDGAIRSLSTLVDVGASTGGVLIGANVAALVVIGLFANKLAASRQAARHTVEIQAWHMRALVPSAGAGTASLP